MKIPVEQFIVPLTPWQAARAEAGAQNGFRVPEKVRIAPRRAARRDSIHPRVVLAGYLIHWLAGCLPSVTLGWLGRVSNLWRFAPRMWADLARVRLFLIEGGRGSDSSANTDVVYWIWPVKKISHWRCHHGC